jgi:PD-(D/E)XK nuclease superfamily protein
MSEVLARGEILSPSQVRCFMDCQMRWWFKYALKCVDPPTGKMALGRAVHAALTQNLAQKVETQEDLPVTVVALFREAGAREGSRPNFAMMRTRRVRSVRGGAGVEIHG